MSKMNYQFSIPVSVLKEGNCYVDYSPALDLSTVGDTFEESQKRFEEAIKVFFDELIEKGTLKEVLLDLGWKKHKNQLVPPQVVSNQITSKV